MTDLGKWATGEYRIPGETLDQLPLNSEDDSENQR